MLMNYDKIRTDFVVTLQIHGKCSVSISHRLGSFCRMHSPDMSWKRRRLVTSSSLLSERNDDNGMEWHEMA
jgi:hypothetical protein